MSKSYGSIFSSNINLDPYVGIDASGNMHIHVCGRCFTNEELEQYISELEARKER